jgi:hypothetical protein
MKEQIMAILDNYDSVLSAADIVWITHEIMKVVEFDRLCDPDVAEASMNEKLLAELYEELEELRAEKEHGNSATDQSLSQRVYRNVWEAGGATNNK